MENPFKGFWEKKRVNREKRLEQGEKERMEQELGQEKNNLVRLVQKSEEAAQNYSQAINRDEKNGIKLWDLDNARSQAAWMVKKCEERILALEKRLGLKPGAEVVSMDEWKTRRSADSN